MYRSDFDQTDLGEAVQARGTNPLERSTYDPALHQSQGYPEWAIVTYRATISFAEAHPKEKVMKRTQEIISILRRP